MRSFHEQRQYFLYGLLAVILGCGDAFHLVPRAVALCTSGLENYTAALGMGKMITSVTMTVFYVLLYYVWKLRYDKKDAAGLRQQYGSWQFCASFCVLCRRINGQAQMLRYLWHLSEYSFCDSWRCSQVSMILLIKKCSGYFSCLTIQVCRLLQL